MLIQPKLVLNDKKFIKSLGIEASSLEGYLYPDTYSFSTNRILFNITEKEAISVLVDEFKRKTRGPDAPQFGDPEKPPPTTLVGVTRLADPDFLVEIDLLAITDA